MSVLIRGVEMPTSCGFCLFEKHTDDGYECRINGCLTEYQKRPSDCPLVSIPPHGRLIDETWLNMQIHTAKEIHANEKHDFCNAFDSNGHVCTEWWCVEDMIENAPTIIEAEEGE